MYKRQVTSALQGNVAGLNFASDASESGTGGEVGGEIKFNIRGIGSINGGEPMCREKPQQILHYHGKKAKEMYSRLKEVYDDPGIPPEGIQDIRQT